MRDPKKIRSLLCIDFETGGLDKKNRQHAAQYPITEFAGVGLDGVTLQEILDCNYDNFVQPYDEALSYSEEASLVTGITKAKCEAEGIPLRDLVNDLVTLIKRTNLHDTKTARPILLGHNVQFDINFFVDIFRRAEVDLSNLLAGERDTTGHWYPHFIDTITLAQQCWGEVTDTDTKYNLGACCRKAGIEHIDAHRAMNDVTATADLFRYFVARLRSGESVTMTNGQATVHRQKFEW